MKKKDVENKKKIMKKFTFEMPPCPPKKNQPETPWVNEIHKIWGAKTFLTCNEVWEKNIEKEDVDVPNTTM